MEQRADAREQAAGAVECGDGVGEGRRRGGSADRVDLGEVLAHRLGERRREVLGADRGERRQAVRAGPRLQKRIAHFFFAAAMRSLRRSRLAISS